MWTAILAVTTVICAVGWLNRWVCCTAWIMYVVGKDYTLPTDEELRACLMEVWKRILKFDL